MCTVRYSTTKHGFYYCGFIKRRCLMTKYQSLALNIMSEGHAVSASGRFEPVQRELSNQSATLSHTVSTARYYFSLSIPNNRA